MTIRRDLEVRQGETWSFVHTVRDAAGAAVNLTGYTARMAVKRGYGTALDAEALLTTGADADGGSIALGGALGTVTLSMTAAQTEALVDDSILIERILGNEPVPEFSDDPSVMFIYDLHLISGAGAVTRELEGKFIVYRGVT